jgi:heme exporter protein CcmD
MGFFNDGPFAVFINGSYGVSVVFLIGVSVLTFLRYQRATKRLAAAGARE